MNKETFLQRILTKMLKKLGLIREYEVDKAEMCRRAVESSVCPKTCESCAELSNIRKRQNNKTMVFRIVTHGV